MIQRDFNISKLSSWGNGGGGGGGGGYFFIDASVLTKFVLKLDMQHPFS